jgi:hypothetical protein
MYFNIRASFCFYDFYETCVASCEIYLSNLSIIITKTAQNSRLFHHMKPKGSFTKNSIEFFF